MCYQKQKLHQKYIVPNYQVMFKILVLIFINLMIFKNNLIFIHKLDEIYYYELFECELIMVDEYILKNVSLHILQVIINIM